MGTRKILAIIIALTLVLGMLVCLSGCSNTKEFEHDNYKFSFDNIIDGNVFRLKKGIDYKETIIFIDYSMFKFIKSSCIPYDISKWTDYLTVTTIKYEITNDSEISKDAIYVKEGNIIYEIEVEPVCVDLYYATKGNKTSIINDNNIPQEISSFSRECFSRKTQLKEVISKMKVKCSKNNVLNNKLNEDYVLDKDKNKININDKEKTLEQYKLSDQIFFVIDFYNDFSECKDITTTNEIKDNEEQYGMKNEEQINNVQYQEEKVFEYLRKMIEVANKYNVYLYHENEKDIYGDTLVRVKRIMDNIDGLKYIYDPANYLQCNEKAKDTIEAFFNKTDYFHIKDVISETGQLVPAGYGDGMIEELLSKIKDDKTLTLEPHLTVFDSFKSIDNTEMKHKFTYNNANEAFDAAVKALKEILIKLGYKEENGVFVK
jgi:hypothetical protein